MPVHIHHEVRTIYDVSVYFGLIEHLALYLLIFLVFNLFKKEISELIPKIKKARVLGVELLFEEVKVEAEQKMQELPPPEPGPLESAWEKQIRASENKE